MFRGSSFHTIDPKGRVIIPAKFRELVRAKNSEGIMVSKMDTCLVAYPLAEWGKVESKILALAERSDVMRRFRRTFIGSANECLFDKQERILIRPELRSYAQLEKDIVLVGVLDHFEIWSRSNWDKENEEIENDMKREEVRNEIAKLGL